MAAISPGARHDLLRDQVRAGSPAWVTCASESMTPTISPGQRVRVLAPRRLRSGDVVVFETGAGDALMLHRVVFAPPGASWFVHVGDAGVRAGIARCDAVVGVADLPRHRPGVGATIKAGRRLVRAARRRLRR